MYYVCSTYCIIYYICCDRYWILADSKSVCRYWMKMRQDSGHLGASLNHLRDWDLFRIVIFTFFDPIGVWTWNLPFSESVLVGIGIPIEIFRFIRISMYNKLWAAFHPCREVSAGCRAVQIAGGFPCARSRSGVHSRSIGSPSDCPRRTRCTPSVCFWVCVLLCWLWNRSHKYNVWNI